jgi:LacI family transcriptional regulator
VTFVAAPEGDPVAEYERLLSARLVDGFVLIDSRHDDPRPGWLREKGLPFVSFGRVWDDPDCTSWIDVDGRSGTADAVRHLYEQGYHRIGYLGWPTGSAVGDDRRDGWLSATRELGIEEPDLQASATQDLIAAQTAATALIERLGVGGGLVCASDTLAVGALQALRTVDDSEAARAFGLSTLAQPLAQVAEELLTLLAGLETGEPAPSQGRVLPAFLIGRDSSERSITALRRGKRETNIAGDRDQLGGTE